jgi:hypothetical protein
MPILSGTLQKATATPSGMTFTVRSPNPSPPPPEIDTPLVCPEWAEKLVSGSVGKIVDVTTDSASPPNVTAVAVRAS